jgi:DNA repair ATPase RecN
MTVDYIQWRAETLAKAQKLTEIQRKQEQEFKKALNEVLTSLPVNKAVLFVTLVANGFLKHALGFDPVLNLTEDDI